MVTRKRLNITLSLHCVSRFLQLNANCTEQGVILYTVLQPVHLPTALHDITNSDSTLFFFLVCYVLHLTVQSAASLSCWASVATPTMVVVVMKTATKFRIPNGVPSNLIVSSEHQTEWEFTRLKSVTCRPTALLANRWYVIGCQSCIPQHHTCRDSFHCPPGTRMASGHVVRRCLGWKHLVRCR
jgi:hypothetical protein